MKPQHRRLQRLAARPAGPSPFEEIRHSVYVSFKPPRASKRESDDFIACDCEGKAENRRLQIECYRRECRANSCIQRRSFPRTEVLAAGPKGFGLFAAQAIAKGVIVGEYTGEIVDAAEVARRLAENSSFYAIQLTAKQFIDATYKGSKVRFANHSCDPNCESQTWFVGAERRVVLATVRPVKKGEELCFNYRFEDWGEERHRCLCGTLRCTGWMDGGR